MTGKRVLLTGATGFIGAHLARALAAAGARVSALARGAASRERLAAANPGLEALDGDIADASSLVRAARRARPEIVFHLAKERAAASFEREAQATLRLACALRDEAPALRRFVRTAHAAPAPGADAGLAEVLRERYALPVVTLELFSVYGPGQPSGDFPSCLFDAAAPPWREAGGGRKDFVHVRDVVRAYLLAGARPALEGERIAIGSGRVRTLPEAAAVLAGLLPALRPWTPSSADAGGHGADLGKARSLLGWSPEIALEDGLREMVECWRRPPEPER